MVSDKTKYPYLVSMLDDRVAAQVMDLIEVPPTSAAYETLKKRLTDTFALTEREKAAKILDCSVLGDCSPSQVLNNLLLYVPTGENPGFLFREIFLWQLPTDVQSHLAQTQHRGSSASELRKLAIEADKYFSSSGIRVSSITDSSATDVPEISAAASRKNQTSSGNTYKFCYYHSRFFKKATKCKEPCDFKRQPGPKAGNGQAS